MEKIERRMAMRVLASVPVAVEYEGQYVEATLRNISASGASIDSARFDPSPGERVRMLLVLSLTEPAYEIVGEIVRCESGRAFALRFTAMDPRLKEAVAKAGQYVITLPDTDPS